MLKELWQAVGISSIGAIREVSPLDPPPSVFPPQTTPTPTHHPHQFQAYSGGRQSELRIVDIHVYSFGLVMLAFRVYLVD